MAEVRRHCLLEIQIDVGRQETHLARQADECRHFEGLD